MTTENHPAYDLGYEAGNAAASWVFDGNTTRETYAWALKGIEDGDPLVLDQLGRIFPVVPTYETLAEELDLDLPHKQAPAYMWDDLDTAVEEWEAGASDGYWHEIERAARYQLED